MLVVLPGSILFYVIILLCHDLSCCLTHRVTSIEHDSKYKRTWGIGGGEEDSDGSKVVSRQPPGVRNGQPAQVNAAAPSGPYIKRWALDYLFHFQT